MKHAFADRIYLRTRIVAIETQNRKLKRCVRLLYVCGLHIVVQWERRKPTRVSFALCPLGGTDGTTDIFVISSGWRLQKGEYERIQSELDCIQQARQMAKKGKRVR